MTAPERLLWRHLRKRPDGLKFRRQHPVGPYIVDFASLDPRFAIEIDGAVHDCGHRAEADLVRARFLEEHGYRLLRVSAWRVMADAVGTAEAIAARLANCRIDIETEVVRAARPLHHPSDGPPPRAGEE